jgi:ribonuclease HI
VTRSSPSRADVFAALAQGADLAQIRERFQLSREQLLALFREVADYYQERESDFWTLNCDGACRGNPGPAGAGAVLRDPSGKTKAQLSRYLGETTNNVAEYQALILGLQLARQHGVRRLRILLDSQLVVEQLNGSYQVRSAHLLPLWRQVRKELQNFEAYAISHVGRESNSQADLLARQGVDRRAEMS